MTDSWDHYNARALSPELIARSFVAPKQFGTISAPRNTVILGARGSGKTTLLRMLEPRAQVVWSDKPLCEIGLFVPVDASWLASLRQAFSVESDERFSSLALAVYTLSVARSAIDSMIYRTKEASGSHPYFADLGERDERDFAGAASEILMLRRGCHSLRDVRFGITSELAMIPQRVMTRDGDQVLSQLSDPVLIASVLCDLFNQSTMDLGRRWNLLCDEIEIAPRAVQEKLFMGLRATPSPLNLKISLTPVVKGLGRELLEQPIPANDYDVETLSYASKSDVRFRRRRNDFCESMWSHSFRDAFPNAESNVSAQSALDEPDISMVVRRRGARSVSRHRKTLNRYQELFKSLAGLDSSFSEYLQRKSVVLDEIELSSVQKMDSVVRKVAPIAEIRLFYKSASSAKLASRSSLTAYTGASRIFDVSEGHPRWLKSMFGALLRTLHERPSVSVADQAKELEFAIQRLNSRIKAVPARKGSPISPHEIIQRIGSFFQNEIHSERFKADPYLSFVVDSKVSEPAISAIEDALFIGALIPMEDEISWLLSDGIYGRRLRLSYWLAPYFKLPLITGKSINLSSIIQMDASDEQDYTPQMEFKV